MRARREGLIRYEHIAGGWHFLSWSRSWLIEAVFDAVLRAVSSPIHLTEFPP